MPDLLTPQEVAERLSVSDHSIRRWAKEGRLRHVTLPSGAIRIPAEVIDEMLATGASATEAAS